MSKVNLPSTRLLHNCRAPSTVAEYALLFNPARAIADAAETNTLAFAFTRDCHYQYQYRMVVMH